ncbi:MAG TPA: universal stress protein [Bacteroidia bacterium]|nr:universal stress protein [Bacteroidia bacterium]
MSAANFNILIPTDFSDQSVQAIKYAVVISKSIQTSLHFIYVIEGPEHSQATTNLQQDEFIKKNIRLKFEAILSNVSELKDIDKLQIYIEKGKVYDRILEKAAAINTKLLIMGCNSAGDYKNRFLGSNALRIMRSCPVPVLSSNQHSQLTKFKNIILPVDLSKDSKDKLNKAIALAKLDSSIILNIVTVVFDADEYLINRLGQQLIEVKLIIEKSKVKYTAEIIKSSLGYESLGEIIADYARKIEGDVIMLLTQQEISHTPYFVSSLAQEIINISEVPVITIAPK